MKQNKSGPSKLVDDDYLASKIDIAIDNAEVIGAKTGVKMRLITKGTINVLKILTVGVCLLVISFIGGLLGTKYKVK